MDTKELLKKVRKIEIKTKRLSDHIFGGEYQSTFKGRGMAFSEVRQYQFGDDVRAIDWNVTARYNDTFIKEFEEERELTMMLIIDISGSNFFGSDSLFKNEYVTELAATLAFSATKNNGVEILLKEIKNYLPEGDFLFPDEGFNFQSKAFEISEIIREKVIRLLGDELPYESAVIVDEIDDQKDLVKLIGSIIVAKNSQKTIVIGKKGEKIKSISTAARKELENYFGKKVYLELWCKVQKNWTDNSKILDGLGIKNRI